MAPTPAKAARLPSGKYAWRGRAVSFSRLPKGERSRFRSIWATKGARTRAIASRKVAARPGERVEARKWLDRRTEKVRREIEHSRKGGRRGLPEAAGTREILDRLGPKGVLGARELQRAAHKAYRGKPGGRAAQIAAQIRLLLGRELAALMPQLWWYH